MDAVSWVLTGLIVILVIAIIYTIYKILAARKAGPSHVETYFDANFRTIIDEWDLVPRPKLKEWKATMAKRLDVVAKDIKYIERQRKSIDGRLDKLESELGKLERL